MATAKSRAKTVRRARSAESGAKPSRAGSVDRRLFVNSVERVFQVLQAFVGGASHLTIAEIAENTGLGRSAVQRFVYTLAQIGYLRRGPGDRQYSLSPRMLEFAAYYFENDSIILNAPYCFEEARDKSGETITLSELDGTDIVNVVRALGRDRLDSQYVVGRRYPAYCSAAGRAILAYLPGDAARDVLDRSSRTKLTRFTLTEPERIMAELATVRAQGYCIADQETYLGTMSIAVPILDRTRMPLASVNVFAPTERWSTTQAREILLPLLQKSAQMLSASLGTPHVRSRP